MKPLLAAGVLLAGLLFALGVIAALLGAATPSLQCASASEAEGASQGGWLATAYGPPWGGIQGDGITATGLNLTAGPAAYEVAVDPRTIALRSYIHVWPNPFKSHSAFYAGDTGGAITGKHIDIYDWQGRAAQDAWGARKVTVTPAPAPGAGNLLGGAAPTPQASEAAQPAAACQLAALDGSIGLSPGQTAHVLPNGQASIPRQAPAAVKRALQAGNLIHTLPYPEPDVHYGTLAKIWPAYDCSGATSFVLYAAGVLNSQPRDSTELESYGDPGAGRWITIYTNSTHAWIIIAGIALDTAEYGGPSIPAGTGPRWRSQPLANLQDGTSYTARHPPGL